MYRFNIVKIKYIFSMQNTIKKVNRQIKDWENTLLKYLANKNIICRRYKEEIIKNKTRIPIKMSRQ